MDLILESKDQADNTPTFDGGGVVVMMTPSLDEDYWLHRVRLSERQAIVAFPKFGTIGVGFAVEEDWNTNLPYTTGVDRIFAHIEHNKGDNSISDDDVRRAIEMVCEAAAASQAGS